MPAGGRNIAAAIAAAGLSRLQVQIGHPGKGQGQISLNCKLAA